IGLGFGPVSLIFRQGSFGLTKRGFEWPRVDLEKQVALLNQASFLIVSGNNVALHLCVDVRVDEPVERGDTFQHPRNVPWTNGCHDHLRRRRGGLTRLTRASGSK